jgi:hypothetical protein
VRARVTHPLSHEVRAKRTCPQRDLLQITCRLATALTCTCLYKGTPDIMSINVQIFCHIMTVIGAGIYYDTGREAWIHNTDELTLSVYHGCLKDTSKTELKHVIIHSDNHAYNTLSVNSYNILHGAH